MYPKTVNVSVSVEDGDKATSPEKEAVTFDLKEKYPELTTVGWREALEFTLIAKQELNLADMDALGLLITLVSRP